MAADTLVQEGLESRLAGQTSELLRLRGRAQIDAALLDLHTACTRQRTVAGTARQIGAVASALLRADAVVIGVCETLSQDPLLAVTVGGGHVDEEAAADIVASLHRAADMAWLATSDTVRVFDTATDGGAVSPTVARLREVLRARRILIAPLLGQGEYVGCIVAGLPANDGATTGQARALQGHAGDLLHLALVIDELRRRALHDAVTGLPNLAVYEQRLARALVRHNACQPGHAEVAALVVKVHGVGRITEQHGATGVQELLRAVAARLSDMAPEHDLGHLGAAQFALIACGAYGAGIDLARAAASYIEEPYVLSFGTVNVQCHIGVAVARDGEADGALLRRAESSAREATVSDTVIVTGD